jgi:hypothetical protein
MSQRPTLDGSTFEGLLAAAWVLQGQHEQQARNHRPAPNEMQAGPRETHVELHCVSERDTDEPDSSFAYQLEDDVSTSHWGRVLVLVVLLGCVAAAVWHWRRDLRDSAARFSQRPAAPAVSSTRPAIRTSTPGSNENEPASGTVRAVSRANPPAGLSAVEGPQGDAQSTMDRNKRTPTSHKIQSLADGVWEKTATKPSAYIPFNSVPMAARHEVRGVSSARPTAAGPRRNSDEHASGTVRASAVAPAGVSRENPPAASSAVDAPQGASLHNFEGQTTRDAQRTMDRNKRTPTDHKIESLAAGGREEAATKPSAGKPFDSVTMATRNYVPRPPPGYGASNIAAMAGHKVARPPSEGGPSANESWSEHRRIAMSRVPRPPWSSTSGRTSEPSVPRPPAERVPRAIPRFDLPPWQVR